MVTVYGRKNENSRMWLIAGLIVWILTVPLLSGVTESRYNNVAAPALFHFLQYIATILVFYYFVL